MTACNIAIKIRMIFGCQNVHSTICLIELTFDNGESAIFIFVAKFNLFCWTIEGWLVPKRVSGNQRRADWKPQHYEGHETFWVLSPFLPSWHTGFLQSSRWQGRSPHRQILSLTATNPSRYKARLYSVGFENQGKLGSFCTYYSKTIILVTYYSKTGNFRHLL